MAGTLPSAELIRVTRILVVHDGVEVADHLHAVFYQPADGGGAGDAFLIIALDAVLRVVNRAAVVLQVLHEVSGQFMRHEFRHERGFGRLSRRAVARRDGELAENVVGSREQIRVARTFRRREFVGEEGSSWSIARAVRVMFWTSSRSASIKTALLVVPSRCWLALALSRSAMILLTLPKRLVASLPAAKSPALVWPKVFARPNIS